MVMAQYLLSFFALARKAHLAYSGSQSKTLGLSLRAGGYGFPPANMSVTPPCYQRKIEEKYNQKKSLAVLFPAYLLFLPGNFEILVTALHRFRFILPTYGYNHVFKKRLLLFIPGNFPF